ncbi:MAG: flagellar basal body P-ring formation chaperone FlgA [Candidatus Sumerlaeia bacterium]
MMANKKHSLRIFPLLLLVGILCGNALADNGKAILRFKAHSEVSDDNYRLGDIAIIEGTEKDRKELASIIIGRSPSLGYKVPLQSGVLKRKLDQLGVDENRAQFIFPKKMLVERAVQEIDLDALRQAVRDKAAKQLPFDKDKIIISDVYMPKMLRVPAGKISYDITIRMPRRTVGTAVFMADIFVDGKKQRSLSGSLKIDVEIEVLQVAEPLTRGEKVNHGNLEVQKRRLSKVYGKPVQPTELGNNMTTKRPMNPGDVLTWRNMEREKLVERNDVVRMILKDGSGLRIATLGKAMQNGAKGDQIELTNIKSGKRVQGIVTGPKTVQVFF